MPKPINHSIGCYYERCREHVENTSPTRSFSLAIEETHEAAGKAGWVMGLDSNGQAHYGCPYHGGALFDARPLQGWFTKRQKRGLAMRAA